MKLIIYLLTFIIFPVLVVVGQIQSTSAVQSGIKTDELFVFPTIPDEAVNAELNFNSIQLVPTPAYLRLPDGGEARMARLELLGGVCKEACLLEILFNGKKITKNIDYSTAPTNLIELALPGDDIAKPTMLEVSLKTKRNIFTSSAIVQPARKWTVYLTPHSHVDVGYTDLQDNVAKLHVQNIDDAIDLAERTINYPEEAKFKWNVEVMWVLDEYLKTASDKQKDRLWDAVKKGWIHFGSCYLNVNTSNMSSEALLKSFSLANKLSREKGFSSEFMYQGDIPGASWGIAGLSKLTGLKYFLLGPNPDGRTGSVRKELEDRPFYWISPDGESKILYYQCYPYNIGWVLKGCKIPDALTVTSVNAYITGNPYKYFLDPALFPVLDNIEEKKLPYDITVLTWSMRDNCPLDPELPDAVVAWNKKYSYPRLVISSMQGFMEAFKKKYHDIIPEFRGELTEYWTDGTGSTALESSLYRRTSERMQQVEVLDAMKLNQKVNIDIMDKTWSNILLFSEHTWGAHNSVISPDLDFVKNIWKKKKSYIDTANEQVNHLLTALTSSKQSTAFCVVNTTAFVQNQLVKLSPASSFGMDMVIDVRGDIVPSQRLSTGELAFVARSIQPFSSSEYTLRHGVKAGISSLKYSDNTIENEYYKIGINSTTGNISSIFSKEQGRELINLNDKFQFNQYIYVLGKNHDIDEYRENNYYFTNEFHKKDSISFAQNPRIRLKESGDVIVTIQINFDAPSCKSMTSEITLVEGIDKITIINTLDKVAERNKEAVHFAFPFLVPDATITYDIPTAYARVNTDQIPGSNKNWYTIQRWLNIANNDFGIVFSSPDASMVEFGKITANLYGSQSNSPLWIKETPPTSTVLSWALNNHWFTNFKADQEGIMKFQYDFAAHKGNSLADVNRFGVTNAQPLIVSFTANPNRNVAFSFDNDQVYVSHIKNSKDNKALIVSVSNVGVEDVVTRIGGLNSNTRLYLTNLNEDKLEGNSEIVSVKAKGYLLLRIE
ncbi:MAG: glycoside hydrolase family 38 C-terminal domain-containing protein [Paludibacter sp.]|jgi:hypothetical protein|nr:glycoside hydrolase family 38 C-terminal domain-containing protein [Paludibacter sp.]